MPCMSYSTQPSLRVDVCQPPPGAACGICCPRSQSSATQGTGSTWVSLPLDHGLARISRSLYCTESRRGEPSVPLSSGDAPAPTEDVLIHRTVQHKNCLDCNLEVKGAFRSQV